MKKHNPYIIITTTIIVLAILFVSFNPISIVQYGYDDLTRDGNNFILTLDKERVDDTTGFIVSMNDAYLKIFKNLEDNGLVLNSVCIIEAYVVNTHNIMNPFTLTFNGVSSKSEGNLVCNIPNKDKIYTKIRSNCDLTLVSSPDSCISSSIFTSLTKVTWSYSLGGTPNPNPEPNPVPDNSYILWIIIGIITLILIYLYIKLNGGKKWLKMLKIR